MIRRALLAAALCLCTSCATVTGTVVGPVTVPIGFWNYSYAIPTWGKVLLVPFAIPLGPIVGFAEGVRCDVGFVQNLEYGVGGHPSFSRVFTPTAPEPDPEGYPPMPSRDRNDQSAARSSGST